MNLVLYPLDSDASGATQMRQEKAQPAGNGPALVKGCNAGLVRFDGALGAGR